MSEIAESRRWDRWPAELANKVFGNQFFARTSSLNAAAKLEFRELERVWEQQGRKPLPAYFRSFGVLDAADHVVEMKRQALAEQKKREQRAPTTAEHQALDALMNAIRMLAPSTITLLQGKHLAYSVAETEALLGELKQHRHYDSMEVFLSARVFAEDFAKALAVFLHEHAHIFGYDGSRGFTDALTGLIEIIVRQRRELDQHESAWLAARKSVLRERSQVPGRNVAEAVTELVGAMHESELRDLLKRLPAETVFQAVGAETARLR